MIPNFKNGWCLMKTTKVKPCGYKGFMFTLYGKDDTTIVAERKAKTATGIWYEIGKLMKKKDKVEK